MANLLGLCCPTCRRDDCIEIAASVWVSLTPSLAKATAGSPELEIRPGSPSICIACGFVGALRDFAPASNALASVDGFLSCSRNEEAWLRLTTVPERAPGSRRFRPRPGRGGHSASLEPAAFGAPARVVRSHAITCGANKKGNIMNKKPTLIAYAVRERGNKGRAIWTRIGAAWAHEKGAGLSVELDALPTDGRLVLIAPKSAEGEDA
jgi:hypothetical protein